MDMKGTEADRLTRQDRQALLSHILATVPAEGRTLSGFIAGQACESSANQREAYRKATERALRRLRREGRAAA